MEPLLESQIYRHRFDDGALQKAREIWKPICAFLQCYVPENGTVLDLGAGHCHFVNCIRSTRKIAVDVNEEVLARYAAPDVECITTSGAHLERVADATVDAVFASNVYEHFPSLEDVARSMREVNRILKPQGRFIILQPNFRFCVKEYFDYFDHRLIFTHLSMTEALTISGFEMEKTIPRFLPYTSKSGLAKAPWLVSLYLSLPVAWKLLGAQMLLVGVKSRR
jgi:SAM-dependent methyltransferase